jgi:hypothetical protein
LGPASFDRVRPELSFHIFVAYMSAPIHLENNSGMPLVRTRLAPSPFAQGYTIQCTDEKDERVTVRVSYRVIDKLEAPNARTYFDRLTSHMDTIIAAAQRRHDAGEIRNRMIYLSVDDFD